MGQYIPVVNKAYICLLANSFGKSVKAVYFTSGDSSRVTFLTSQLIWPGTLSSVPGH